MRVTSIEETEHYDQFKHTEPVTMSDPTGAPKEVPGVRLGRVGARIRTKIVKFECDGANLTVVLERVGDASESVPVNWEAFHVGVSYEVRIAGSSL